MRAFLNQDQDRRRIPVGLISGFLGSGKTTLVNALLRDPRLAGTAVAINEFGPVPLDHELIDHGADRTVVMANGCLCCNLAGDMEQAVMRLFSRRAQGDVPAFARLRIEPSGLSDPAPIVQALLRNPLLSRAFRLERIVTTVDAVFAAQQLTDYAESRKQVALADVLVLTKSDLASFSAKRQVDDALQRLNPVANVHVATHGAVDAAALFPPSLFTPTGSHEIPAREPFYAEDVTASKHLDRILAVTLVANAALTWSAFERWLRDIRLTYAEQILRLKGLVDVVGSAGPVVVQGVHHVLHTPVELGSWPHDEQGTRLLFIVQDLLPDVLRTRWHDFLLAERVCV